MTLKQVRIDALLSSGGQPTEADIAALKAQGVTTIINLRRPGEQSQPLDPVTQGEVVRRAGLAYVHIPVDPKNLDPSQVDEVARAIEAGGHCYVHCGAGGRATTHALLSRAKAAGHSADEVLAKAEAAGAPITDEGFKAFVRTVAGPGRK